MEGERLVVTQRQLHRWRILGLVEAGEISAVYAIPSGVQRLDERVNYLEARIIEIPGTFSHLLDLKGIFGHDLGSIWGHPLKGPRQEKKLLLGFRVRLAILQFSRICQTISPSFPLTLNPSSLDSVPKSLDAFLVEKAETRAILIIEKDGLQWLGAGHP